MWIALPIALLAGLVSFLSPCVLPLVPGYLGFIGGAVSPRPEPVAAAAAAAPRRGAAPVDAAPLAETPSRGRLLVGVLLFVAGFTVVFMAVNILGGTVGRFFLEYADPITRVMGVIIVLLGLVFIGLFGFAQRTFKPQVRGNVGLIGAPLLGLALGIGWAPCIGPTLGAILAMSWNFGDPVRAGLLGLAYSLGLGIPFILLTLGFGWATRSVGFLRRHIRTVNLVGGVLLVVLGILMVSGVWTALMAQLQGVFLNVPLPL
ncbi:cytochrome c biogenesis protein CcdA [Microbacterium sp. zg.B48]|nr:cytochrome c biogenesis protein CcdA [Microbacterium sp. zg.B48]MCR2810834.1 cytochrome c biogenesis protein CcdA [Microbacterium sp. zg.B185]